MTFFLAIIVLGIIVSMAGGGEETATDTDSGNNEQAAEEKIYKLNEVVKVDQAEVTVTKFEEEYCWRP